jgi:hypothetical protein
MAFHSKIHGVIYAALRLPCYSFLIPAAIRRSAAAAYKESQFYYNSSARLLCIL